VKSILAPGLQPKPVTVGGHHKAPQHPRGWGKVGEAVLALSDGQVVELMRQLHEVERQSPDINPEALRRVLACFLRRPPKC
jgi:hypothetical protein